jgi:hypothetical protein
MLFSAGIPISFQVINLTGPAHDPYCTRVETSMHASGSGLDALASVLDRPWRKMLEAFRRMAAGSSDMVFIDKPESVIQTARRAQFAQPD